MRTAAAIAFLACVTVVTGGAASAQRAGTAPPVEVTGATYAELDEVSGLWTLRGSPVTVRRGAVVVQAPSITYDTRRQMVGATGGASYTDASLLVQALQVTVWIQEQRLLATGSPVVRAPEGTLSAERIEAFSERDEVVADGSARFVYADIDGAAARVVLRRGDGMAVLSGGAVVRQGRNEMRAQTITADLRRRRIIASGGASITVYPER